MKFIGAILFSVLVGCAKPATPTTPAPAPTSAPAPAEPAPAPAPTSAPAPTPAPTPAKQPACAVNTDFDFWVGAWEVSNPAGTVVGHNRIEKIQAGCMLLENWKSVRGSTGTSVNYIDPSTKEWVQLWVDASGGVISLRGKLDGTAMFLVGDYVTGAGKKTGLRGRWTPNVDGSVRQHFEESTDNGKTWKTWFDGTYRRVK